MRDFRGLKAWQRAYTLSLDIYRATKAFPVDERFGLTSQLRRAAVSIGANIAEGCGHRSDREVGRFMQFALASASELEHELLLARDLHLLDSPMADDLIARTIEVRRMLTPIVARLQHHPPRPSSLATRD